MDDQGIKLQDYCKFDDELVCTTCHRACWCKVLNAWVIEPSSNVVVLPWLKTVYQVWGRVLGQTGVNRLVV